MKEFTVYQIRTTREQYDRVNAGGWAVLEEAGMEALRAKQHLMFEGSADYEPWMAEHFQPVVGVRARDLNHVFELTNLWNDQGAVSMIAEGQPHSTSVGDIILDVEADEYYMVDMFGFSKIHFPEEA